MIDPIWLGMGFALPAVIAAAVMLAFTLPRSTTCSPARTTAAWSVIVAGGWLLVLYFTYGTLHFPPTVAEERAVYAVTLAGVIGVIAVMMRVPASMVFALQLAIAAALPAVLLVVPIQNDWKIDVAVKWLTGMSLAMTALLALMHPLESRAGRDLAIALAGATMGMGLVIAMSDSERMGRLAMGLAAVLGGAGVAAFRIKCDLASRGFVGISLLAYGAMLMLGYHYTYDPYNQTEGLKWYNAVLLAIAPLLAWIPQLPPAQKRSHRWQAVVRVAAVWLPVAVAIGIAAVQFQRDTQEGW